MVTLRSVYVLLCVLVWTFNPFVTTCFYMPTARVDVSSPGEKSSRGRRFMGGGSGASLHSKVGGGEHITSLSLSPSLDLP